MDIAFSDLIKGIDDYDADAFEAGLARIDATASQLDAILLEVDKVKED